MLSDGDTAQGLATSVLKPKYAKVSPTKQLIKSRSWTLRKQKEKHCLSVCVCVYVCVCVLSVGGTPNIRSNNK